MKKRRAHFERRDRLFCRDYLLETPVIDQEDATLKRSLSQTYYNDPEAYTKAKTDFIVRITKIAKEHYTKARSKPLPTVLQ